MPSTASHKLKLGVLDALSRRAAAEGRSLEAEIERLRAGRQVMTVRDRVDSARHLRAMTPPDGPDGRYDSTLLIRWLRDTDGGNDTDGWQDNDAGR